MKRLILFFFSALLCTAASAHEIEVDDIYYNIESDTDLTVSVTYKGSGSDSYSNEYTGSVVIPEKITFNNKEYSVTCIGADAFKRCTGLTSVTIPNSVTSIELQAFYGCSALTSVTIGNSVTNIGNNAFYATGWYNNHSDGIMYLDSWLIGYKGDRPTGTLEIKEGTKGIGYNAFRDCSGLTSVTIPNSVTSIGNYAFYGCSGLTSVTIPNSVTTIGNYAFYGCKGLMSVTIPNSVTSIGQEAFRGCN